MFRNYFITALRRLLRNPVTSVINIVGLATGLACAFLVLMFVKNETSYDRHHKDSDRIYRINSQLTLEGKTDKIAAQSMRAAPELKEMFPEIESYMRLSRIGTITIKNGDKMVNESNICLADSNLFDFFDFKIVAGDIKTGIKKQRSASDGMVCKSAAAARRPLPNRRRNPAKMPSGIPTTEENKTDTQTSQRCSSVL